MDRATRPAQASHEVEVLSSTVRISLAGEFDLAVERELSGWLNQAIQDHPGMDFDVDVHDVGFLDSSGIRALLNAYRSVTAKGCAFRLTRAQGTVREVLEIVDVYELLTGH
jgi:anti-sigma B factor antagonist